MIHPGTDRFVIICLTVLAPVLAGACGDSAVKNNSPEPCTSGAWLHIPLDPSVVTMAEPKVSVCRNGECHDWDPMPLRSTGSNGDYESFPSAAWIIGTFWHNSDGSVTLDVQWSVVDESQLQDGDHYVVTLADGNGVLSTVLDQIAVYARSAPGPADSGPTCLQATLTP